MCSSIDTPRCHVLLVSPSCGYNCTSTTRLRHNHGCRSYHNISFLTAKSHGLSLAQISGWMQSSVHAISKSPCTACCEPCHEVCSSILTEGMALPCRALNPVTLGWSGDNLTSCLMAHPIRLDIVLDCLSLSVGCSHLASSRICWHVHGKYARMDGGDDVSSCNCCCLMVCHTAWQPQLRVCLLLTPHVGQVTMLLDLVHMLQAYHAGCIWREQPYLKCAGCLLYKVMRTWWSQLCRVCEAAILPGQTACTVHVRRLNSSAACIPMKFSPLLICQLS